MTPMSRYPCCSCIKPIRQGVSKMTRSLTYVGVLVVVAGVLLTTCVGSGWMMMHCRVSKGDMFADT